MSAERVAVILRCAECEAVWLAGDEERWRAYLTDDEQSVAISTGRSAPTASSRATDR
jgi:hypothetical protein